MEQLQNHQENIHKVVSKERLEYLHGVIVGVIKHSAKQRGLKWRESILLIGPQLSPTIKNTITIVTTIKKFVVTEKVSDQPLPSLPITCEPTISSPPEVHRMEPLAQGSSSAASFKASGLFYKLQGRAPFFIPRQVQQLCGISACAQGRNTCSTTKKERLQHPANHPVSQNVAFHVPSL